LTKDRWCIHASDLGKIEPFPVRLNRLTRHSILAAVCFLVSQHLWAQVTEAAAKPATPSDLFVEGYAAFGSFKFAGGASDALDFTGGIEYDRHSLGSRLNPLGMRLGSAGRLVKARLDYAAEILPLFLLREPAKADQWGNPLTTARQTLPGLGITPLGMRLLWRSNKAVKPYWSVKLGGVVFTQKALSPTATYANFTIQSSVGTQVRLTPGADLRMGFEFFHFSNAYVNGSNPGLDTLGINFGINYHLLHKRK
jgi:hypothetical protein